MNAFSDIAQTIQLSVAPVFLLAGIGALLNVAASRLSRVVDRSRALEHRLTDMGDPPDEAQLRSELMVLGQRMLLAQRSISLCSLSALLVCVLVITLFVVTLAELNGGGVVAALFIAAMVALIGGLFLFLAEVTIATQTLRWRAELFMKE